MTNIFNYMPILMLSVMISGNAFSRTQKTQSDTVKCSVSSENWYETSGVNNKWVEEAPSVSFEVTPGDETVIAKTIGKSTVSITTMPGDKNGFSYIATFSRVQSANAPAFLVKQLGHYAYGQLVGPSQTVQVGLNKTTFGCGSFIDL